VKKRTLRVIVVGYGNVGEQLARLLAVEPCCRVVAVVDPRRRALEKATSLYQVSTFPDLEKALGATDADVAVISTPPQHCYGLAAIALERGLHVLVSKSIAVVRDAPRIMAMAHARRRKPFFGHDPISLRDYLRELG
jgi:predicted dehydrogenase